MSPTAAGAPAGSASPAPASPRAALWHSGTGLQLAVDPLLDAALDEPAGLADEVQVFEKIRAMLRGAQGSRALGYLSGTTYQLRFKPDGPLPPPMRHLPPAFLTVPMGSIRRVERAPAAAGQPPVVDVVCKDVRTLQLMFEDEISAETVLMRLRMVAFPAKMDYLFAFAGAGAAKRPKKGDPAPPPAAPLAGWDVYDFRAEVERLGLLRVRHPATGDPLFRVSELNRAFEYCPTYPPLLVFPARAPDLFMGAVAGFRSKARVPVLTWMHPGAKTTLWRCSQPKVGLQGNKCAQDEAMLAFIREANVFTRMGPTAQLIVVDCRPKLNAQANYASGGGYESYGGTVVVFCAFALGWPEAPPPLPPPLFFHPSPSVPTPPPPPTRRH